jgi:hypothetical protein
LKARHANKGKRGSATVFIAVSVVGMGAMSLSLLAINLSVEKEQRGVQRDMTAFYAAEAGIALAYQDVLNGGIGALGSADAPLAFGRASYFVESTDLGGFQTSLVATGIADNAVSRAELILIRRASGLFQYAAFGDDGVLLNSAALVDSYDSTDGSYASQFDAADGYAGDQGNVGSNLDIVLEANTLIAGDVSPGPTGILDDNAPMTVITGTTNPLPTEMELPPIDVPVLAASASIPGSASGVVLTGDQYVPSIAIGVGETLTINGPATLVTDHLELSSNSNLVIDATAGPVEIYGTGTFILKSNAFVTTLADSAVDISVFLTGDNWGLDADGSQIDLLSNSSFVGSIYAPNAYVMINSNFELFGGVIGDYVELNSNSIVHFDETLATAGGDGSLTYDTLLWRPLGD